MEPSAEAALWMSPEGWPGMGDDAELADAPPAIYTSGAMKSFGTMTRDLRDSPMRLAALTGCGASLALVAAVVMASGGRSLPPMRGHRFGEILFGGNLLPLLSVLAVAGGVVLCCAGELRLVSGLKKDRWSPQQVDELRRTIELGGVRLLFWGLVGLFVAVELVCIVRNFSFRFVFLGTVVLIGMGAMGRIRTVLRAPTPRRLF